jgi:hypothetical protein
MAANKLRWLAAITSAVVFASSPALSDPLPGFGAPSDTPCWRCEPSGTLRLKTDIPLPEHAIFLDFETGELWKNSQTILVDLDSAEVLVYRFPPDQDRPTKLQLVSKNTLSPERLSDLLQKAAASWNPPVPKLPPATIPDISETVYVVDGSTMASWMRGTSSPVWYVALTEAIRNSVSP